MATELFAAIKGGDTAAVERLLDQDRGLVDARDESGLSPILVALYRGRGEIAAAILREGPRLSVFDAAAAGVLGRVRDLVAGEGSLANATSPDGFSPLGLAAFFKRRKIVRYLLDAGADPRLASRDQRFTPLHSAVATDTGAGDVELVHMLLRERVWMSNRWKGRSDGLQVSPHEERTHEFHGEKPRISRAQPPAADPSVRTNDGKTPGDVAIERGHLAVADLLRSRWHAPSASEVY